MSFEIRGLDPAPFVPLFGKSDAELAALGARRCIADRTPGFPDRVALNDAEPGESLLLLNYAHQPAATPFRSAHAIFVREVEARPFHGIDRLPPVMTSRPLSIRAFDAEGFMVDADLAHGEAEVREVIARLLGTAAVAYLHAHFARMGCFAARVDSAS